MPCWYCARDVSVWSRNVLFGVDMRSSGRIASLARWGLAAASFQSQGFHDGPSRAHNDTSPIRAEGMYMKTAHSKTDEFQDVLERKQAELVRVLRKRDGIAIEKSADQMDEIQLATERDLAIRNVDRESNLLRDVKDALRRIQDGDFGTCLECEEAISPKRLAAVPWAARCIQCQEAVDLDRQEGTDSFSSTLVHAA
jgi:DnaK suppressor protein